MKSRSDQTPRPAWSVKRLILTPVLTAMIGGAVWAGSWFRDARRVQATLADVQLDLQQARHAVANRELIELLKRKPDCDQAIYLLGVCQKARGDFDLAFQTWGRVRPGTPFTVPAILERGMMLATAGRWADAERLAKNALDDSRIEPAGLRWFLAPIYWREGRREEARRVLKANWDDLDFTREGTLDQAVKLVRTYAEWSLRPPPIEEIRGILDQAGAHAPDDERVWLGRANLAIRTGSLDEAARWIDACLRRGPDDPAVWRARLGWAVKAGDAAMALTAASRLPAGSQSPTFSAALDAWFAADRGDAAAERSALKRLIHIDPDQPAVIDRLTALNPSEADLPVKAELETLRARYRVLLDRNQPGRDAPELARLAERLGRWFEAQAFWTIAKATDWSVPDLPGVIAQLKSRERPQSSNSRPSTPAESTAQPSNIEKSPILSILTD